MLWTRIALYATLGYTLDALGQGFTTWGFWAVLGLFWASEHLTRVELLEQIHKEVAEWRRKNPEQAQQLENNKDNDRG